MRILMIAPWVPGTIRPRSLGILRRLAREHEVTLLAATWNDADSTDLLELRASGVEVIDVRLSRVGAVCRAFLALFSRKTLQQAYLDSTRLRRAIRAAVRRGNPDLCYFNVIRTAQFVSLVGTRTRVIDLDEFRSAYYSVMAERGSSPAWRLLGLVEHRRMRAAEAQALESFDRLLVSSPTDLRAESPGVRLVRSPVAFEARSAPPLLRQREEAIVFVGRQSYRANHEAALWLLREIAPVVVAARPSAVFYIVGDAPAAELIALAGPNIIVTGRVDKVEPYYRRARVSVAPISMATGVQMKLIESLLLGVPAVVSPAVATGAGISHGEQCLIGDSPEEWVDAILHVLDDAHLASTLSSAGFDWAMSHHGRAAVDRQLEDALGDLLTSTVGGPR